MSLYDAHWRARDFREIQDPDHERNSHDYDGRDEVTTLTSPVSQLGGNNREEQKSEYPPPEFRRGIENYRQHRIDGDVGHYHCRRCQSPQLVHAHDDCERREHIHPEYVEELPGKGQCCVIVRASESDECQCECEERRDSRASTPRQDNHGDKHEYECRCGIGGLPDPVRAHCFAETRVGHAGRRAGSAR